jgi:Holliday junction resolvase-like predicted endonuclease
LLGVSSFALFDDPRLMVVLVSGLLLAAIAWLTLRIRRTVLAWLLRRRFRAAVGAELRAERWLERHGFRIVDRQIQRRGEIHVDGEPYRFDVRADLIVERDGERALVEIKTGEAAEPNSSATRRQMLEYGVVFGVPALYLFDADHEQLMHVRFAALERSGSGGDGGAATERVAPRA